jgi:hypothetical protein
MPTADSFLGFRCGMGDLFPSAIVKLDGMLSYFELFCLAHILSQMLDLVICFSSHFPFWRL